MNERDDSSPRGPGNIPGNIPGNTPGPSRKGPLMALVVIVVLVVGGLWLSRHMRANGIMEDCLMSGRKNCAPITQ